MRYQLRSVRKSTALRGGACGTISDPPNPVQLGFFLSHNQVRSVEIYSQASSKATREALKKLGESLG